MSSAQQKMTALHARALKAEDDLSKSRDEIALLHTVVYRLLESYLASFGGNKDALAHEALALLGANGQQLNPGKLENMSDLTFDQLQALVSGQ